MGSGGELRRRHSQLSIRTSTEGGGGRQPEEAVDQPLSPAARLFHEPHFNCHVVVAIGSVAPIDATAVRAALADTLVHHPRFCSIPVFDKSMVSEPLWTPVKVNINDHVVIPDLGDAPSTAAAGDKLVEDYVAELSVSAMASSRPLWEIHILNVATSEAAGVGVLRIHHSLGDGTSLLSLFLASCNAPAGPGPAAPTRRVRAPPASGSPHAFFLRTLSTAALAWNTLVDVTLFAATSCALIRDSPSPFKGAEGVEHHRKRFVHRTISLDDVKLVKNAMKCTVNDVLIGITSLALSKYYFRTYRETEGQKKIEKKIRVRTTLLVNIRPTPGVHALAEMMNGNKDNPVKWGNQLGFIIMPFPIVEYNDPLDYVRKGQSIANRKKKSFEAICSFLCAKYTIKFFGIKTAAALNHRVQCSTTFSFSNMLGPSEQIMFAGHPVAYIAPSVYGHPQGLTVHYQSYMKMMKVVLAVDDTLIPDPHRLLDDFADSLEIIRHATLSLRP